MARPLKHKVPIVAPQFRMPRGAVSKYQGNQVIYSAVATFDPSANSGERTIAAHGLGVYIPTKAVITRVFVDVVTTFTSANDSGTIALHIQSANDLVSAIAISDATNPWDAGLHGTLTAGTTTLTEAAPNTRTAVVNAADIAAGYLKTTAEREITATVAVQALTAGKANIFIEYFISD